MFAGYFTTEVLADSDEFHLRRDYSLSSIVELGHNLARFGPERVSAERRWNWRIAASGNGFVGWRGFLDVPARLDPGTPQRRQPRLHITIEICIAPWARAIVHPH